MNISPEKEIILKKIRKALTQTTPLPFPAGEGSQPLFQPLSQEPEVEFAEQFSKLLGKFVYCLDEAEMRSRLSSLINQEKWTKIYCDEKALRELTGASRPIPEFYGDISTCDVAITGCECLIARTGSMVLSSAQESGRRVSVYAPVHICIAYTNQLVYDVRDGLQLMKEKYSGRLPSLMTFATGPSRTADIEKTLVVGVHGPKEVFVFLIESPDNVNKISE